MDSNKEGARAIVISLGHFSCVLSWFFLHALGNSRGQQIGFVVVSEQLKVIPFTNTVHVNFLFLEGNVSSVYRTFVY